MRTRILGARVIDPASGLDQVTDLYLQGGKIAAFGQAPADFVADQTIDATGLVAAPGLVAELGNTLAHKCAVVLVVVIHSRRPHRRGGTTMHARQT